MRRVALLVVLLTLLAVPATVGAQQPAAPAHPDTLIHVAVQDNGDARWSITVRIPLETANDTAAFDRLRGAFTGGSGTGYLSVSPFREAAKRVSKRTGQDMAITDVRRTADVETVNHTTVGTLTLAFTWTNFARTSGDRVSVGAAFEGGWFGDLGPNQSLLIEPPPGYRVHNVEPGVQGIVNGTLVWDGPQSFGPGQPVMTFVPIQSGGPVLPIQLTAPIFLLLGIVVGSLLLVAWRRDWLTEGGRPVPPTGAGEPVDEPTADEGGPPAPPPTGDEDGGVAATEAATVAEAAAKDDTDDEDAIDEELLSDEERVERLLRENGGRMKQARIVEETRWSNAKVSQLLSAMAEADRVEKLRLGRENLISLPDDDEE